MLKSKKNKQTDIENLHKGFLKACSEVATTMGAEGGFAVIAGKNEEMDIVPISTKDGVTTVRKIFYDDPCMNTGAYFAKQASARTLVKAGDATTTTLVFAKAIVEACQPTFFNRDIRFNSRVREGIETAQREVENYLKEYATKIDNKKIFNIAKVSANGDEEIAKAVADAYIQVGETGTVDVKEDRDNTFTSLIISNGMTLNKGWKSPFLITNQSTGVFEAENANILVYEGNIGVDNAQFIADSINPYRNEPIVIFCEHVSDDVMLNICNMHRQGKLNICVVESPYYGEQRQAILKDIALYCGGEEFIQGTSKEVKMGKVSKIIISEDSTSLVQNEVSQEVKNRAEELKKQLENTSEKDFFKRRISNLEGKAATIMVGAVVEGSLREKRDRADDSVCAVRSAVQEGVVPGGGSALVYISSRMKTKFKDKDKQFGYELLKKALEAPFKTVLENAKVKPSRYLNISRRNYGFGYNVKTNKVEDLEDSGVIDPAKSLRIALENAVSTSTLLLNTKVVI